MPVNEPWVNRPTTDALQELTTATFQVRRTVMTRGGLNDTELSALERLSLGASSPSELARHMQVSTAAATGVVDRLAARGHVERRPHPSDRRRTEVHMTTEGHAHLDAQLRPMLVALTELDERLDDDERAVVLRFLQDAVQAYSRVGPL